MAEHVWKCRTHEEWEEGPIDRDSRCQVWWRKNDYRDGLEDEPERCEWVPGWFIPEGGIDYKAAAATPLDVKRARHIVNAALGIDDGEEK